MKRKNKGQRKQGPSDALRITVKEDQFLCRVEVSIGFEAGTLKKNGPGTEDAGKKSILLTCKVNNKQVGEIAITSKDLEGYEESFAAKSYLRRYLEEELTEVAHRILVEATVIGLGGLKPSNPDTKKWILHQGQQEMKRWKSRFGVQRERTRRSNVDNLLTEYNTVLPLWQDAKSIFKGNAARNWRAFIKAEHPYLPDDLVLRLSNNPDDLTEDVKCKLAEKGGTSEPSDIALEHAARLCGAPDYCYALSTLESYKAKQRRFSKIAMI
jgi:hypothetical protein